MKKPYPPALCSECEPSVGKWHGDFEKCSADGMILANDEFLYSKEEVQSDKFQERLNNHGFEILGVVDGDEVKPWK